MVGAICAVVAAHYDLWKEPALPLGDASALGPVAASWPPACIWRVIPAFFKAHWNTNETLLTLMLNYIALLSPPVPG